MKYSLAAILCWMALSPLAVQAAPTVPAAELWGRIEALRKTPEPELEKVDDKPILTKEYLEAQAKRNVAITDLLLEFVEKYSSDSRHWDAVSALATTQRQAYKSLGDVRREGWKAVVIDEEAQEAWAAKVTLHVESMIAAEGVSAENREAAYNYWVDDARSAIRGAEKPDLSEFRRRLDAMKADFPQSKHLKRHEWQYLIRLRRIKPEAVSAHLAALTQSPNEAVATWAKGELNTEALRKTPVAYKFTALDGRKVDMSKMRGKVVLLDFWATWCGPCKAEIPNVVANYEKYHGRGFEVIAVSLDDEKDKQKLIDYIAENKLPWPQHFDGKGWKNEIASNHAIMGIPAMFLFDKKGLLVSTGARGEKLEPEIKRLLGIR